MVYRFRRDWKVIVTSVLAIVAVPIVLGVAWYVEGGVEALIALPIWFVVMAAVILRTPRYFYIDKDVIIVKFFLGSKVLEGIRSVRPIGEAEMRRCVRTFGNGLFCQAGIKTHLVPQSVADLAFGLQEIYHFGVIFVGRKVKRIPVENEIPV